MVEVRTQMVSFFLGGLSIVVLQSTLELSDKLIINNSTLRQELSFSADAEHTIQSQREREVVE